MKSATVILIIASAALFLSSCGAGETQESVDMSRKAELQHFEVSFLDEEAADKPTCYCTGGPGNYRHECPAVEKTCYAGPGNYPYACWVCPQ